MAKLTTALLKKLTTSEMLEIDMGDVEIPGFKITPAGSYIFEFLEVECDTEAEKAGIKLKFSIIDVTAIEDPAIAEAYQEAGSLAALQEDGTIPEEHQMFVSFKFIAALKRDLGEVIKDIKPTAASLADWLEALEDGVTNKVQFSTTVLNTFSPADPENGRPKANTFTELLDSTVVSDEA